MNDSASLKSNELIALGNGKYIAHNISSPTIEIMRSGVKLVTTKKRLRRPIRECLDIVSIIFRNQSGKYIIIVGVRL